MDFRHRLLELIIQTGSFKEGDFTFSGGGKSKYYFDGRILTLTPEPIYLISDWILTQVASLQIHAIGGPTLGADPIVTGVSLLSHMNGQIYGVEPVLGFVVRKEPKEHGTKQLLEGPPPGKRVAIVDDTSTTGGSLFHAIEQAESAGCEVVRVYTIADWKEFGGSTKIIEQGYEFTTLFTLSSTNGISLSESTE